jgi:hypothetical protein
MLTPAGAVSDTNRGRSSSADADVWSSAGGDAGGGLCATPVVTCCTKLELRLTTGCARLPFWRVIVSVPPPAEMRCGEGQGGDGGTRAKNDTKQ